MTQIPPTTTIEAIIDKIIDRVKAGVIREISDVRDETGLAGMKLTIDLKRGVEPGRSSCRSIFRITPLEDTIFLQLQCVDRRSAARAGCAKSCSMNGSPSA